MTRFVGSGGSVACSRTPHRLIQNKKFAWERADKTDQAIVVSTCWVLNEKALPEFRTHDEDLQYGH